MRLTVGPLPPAVYWRRRAVVLGAGLLFLIVLLYSCSGSDRNAGPTGDAQPGPTSSSAAPGPTGSVLAPQTGTPSPGTSGGSGGDPSADPTTTNVPPAAPAAPVAPVVDAGTCTDAEITVTPVARPATVVRGATVDLQLKIRNISERTCSRDVGADVQELFIKSGAEKIWSSDTCGSGKGSDVQSFTPDFERSYQLGWNGRDASRCADGVAAGPNPPAGTYQLFARVGTELSEPVKLTITS